MEKKNKEVLYQFRINRELWEDFQAYLRKIYWKEKISLDRGIIKLIEEFVKKNKENEK
jgi:hypothetical protein